MENIDPDGNSYYINFGHKVEAAVLYFFQGLIMDGQYKIDRELHWLSATSDATVKIGNIYIPLEIKATKKNISIEEIIKINYHQLCVTMRVFSVEYLFLLTYQESQKVFKLYKVFQDPEYEKLYLSLIERGFYRHLAKYLLLNIDEKSYLSIINRKAFKTKFMKYYSGDFDSDPKINKRHHKILQYEHIMVSDLFNDELLADRLIFFRNEFKLRVRRKKIFYREFEKMYESKCPEFFKDYQIQDLLIALVNQISQ